MRDRLEAALTIAGVVTVAVGAYAPMIRVNPDLPPDAPVPQLYLPGMETGISGVDVLVLAPVGVVLALIVADGSRRIWGILALAAGLLAMFIAVFYPLEHRLVGFGDTFVPGLGWYVTVLGGALLVAGASLTLYDLLPATVSER
jgi:hypothetical protein